MHIFGTSLAPLQILLNLSHDDLAQKAVGRQKYIWRERVTIPCNMLIIGNRMGRRARDMIHTE